MAAEIAVTTTTTGVFLIPRFDVNLQVMPGRFSQDVHGNSTKPTGEGFFALPLNLIETLKRSGKSILDDIFHVDEFAQPMAQTRTNEPCKLTSVVTDDLVNSFVVTFVFCQVEEFFHRISVEYGRFPTVDDPIRSILTQNIENNLELG
jgi:hypothetical protein